MKTKIVTLTFNLIVEVEDSAAHHEIMEYAAQKMDDLYADGQLSAEALTENNLVNIADNN